MRRPPISEIPVQIKARAALSTLVIFETFSLGIFSLFLYAGLVRHAGWEGALVSGGACILILVWWRGFLVEIDESELRYRSFPWGKKVVPLRKISKVVRRQELISQANRPPNRIEIYATVNGRDVSFDINVKPFTLADVRRIEELLKVEEDRAAAV